MSNPLKKIGKALKSVGKAVKKVFKSDLFKVVAIGAGLFFGIPMAATALGVGAGAAGGAAAGAGAGAWWSSTLGVGATTAGTAAGTATTAGTAAAGSAFPASIAGMTPMASTVAAPQAAGLMGAAPAMTGSLGQAAAGGFTASVAGGASGASSGSAFGNLGTQEVIGNTVKSGALDTTREAGKGLLGRAMDGFNNMSPLAQGTLVNVAGQGISGMAKARAEQKALEEQYRREDEERNRQSIFGVRYDGSRPLPGYDAGQMMNQAIGGYQPSFANWNMAPQRPKQQSEGLLGYNPYVYRSA